MLRHEGFLERIHVVLSQPGADVAQVTRVLEDAIRSSGELIPRDVVISALAIQDALARGGLLSARRTLDAFRRREPFAPRVSGFFSGPELDEVGNVSSDRGAAGHLHFTLEQADDGGLALLSGWGAERVRVGEPRHVAIVNLAYEKAEISLLEAITVSGTAAYRNTRVFYETRDWMGHEWWEHSDEAGPPPNRRMLRLRAPPAGQIVKVRVRTLSVVTKIAKRRGP